MVPGEALLLHGTIPPTHLRVVRWWTERRLQGLFPADPPSLSSCPLTTIAAQTGPVLDASTMRASQAQLPRLTGGPAGGPQHRGRWAGTNRDQQMAFPLADEAMASTLAVIDDVPECVPDQVPDRSPGQNNEEQRGVLRVVNRVAGRCERCGTQVVVGGGTQRLLGGRSVICCWPACGDPNGGEW
jgi:hypothetical protein